MSAVAVGSLRVTYPEATAPSLTDVTLTLGAGDSLLVVGASGSGKSTLLAALAGILGHTVDADVSGTVHLAGADVTAGGPLAAARVAGLVQQDPLAQTCLDTVDAEVELVAENRALDPALVPARAAAALGAAGADHLRGRRTAELSGGQLQRVALAAALAGEPSVLLLDEPTALLDPRAAHALGALVGELGAATTTVVVEHRLDDLRPLPDRVLVLDGGRPVALGETAQVLAAHGHRLLGSGCWVPLATLLRVAGAPGPLGDSSTDAWLAGLPDRADRPGGRPDTHHAPDESRPDEGTRDDGGRDDVVLDARGFGVSRTRRPDGPWSRRRSVDVVRDVDLRVRRGEVVGVVGVNGCGKSTLLRGLAGLERSTGHLRAGRTTLVVQHPEQQFLCRTVADELAHGPRLAGLGEAEVARRVDRLVRHFGLDGLTNRSPHRLSGGQQRRLSVATALAVDVDVLLADEPTFGLDRRGTLAVARLLRAAADKPGATPAHDDVADGPGGPAGTGRAAAGVVVVSHDLELLARCADRLLVLDDGGVRALGPIEALLSDARLLGDAGLAPTDLLAWWAGQEVRPPLRRMLRALDNAVDRAARGAWPHAARPHGATPPVAAASGGAA